MSISFAHRSRASVRRDDAHVRASALYIAEENERASAQTARNVDNDIPVESLAWLFVQFWLAPLMILAVLTIVGLGIHEAITALASLLFSFS
jgi:hypothetical protein